jgi:hypothetical protein
MPIESPSQLSGAFPVTNIQSAQPSYAPSSIPSQATAMQSEIAQSLIAIGKSSSTSTPGNGISGLNQEISDTFGASSQTQAGSDSTELYETNSLNVESRILGTSALEMDNPNIITLDLNHDGIYSGSGVSGNEQLTIDKIDGSAQFIISPDNNSGSQATSDDGVLIIVDDTNNYDYSNYTNNPKDSQYLARFATYNDLAMLDGNYDNVVDENSLKNLYYYAGGDGDGKIEQNELKPLAEIIKNIEITG